nr:tetratricopeptide repeat protein [Methylophaga nitratireducenticrescens]
MNLITSPPSPSFSSPLPPIEEVLDWPREASRKGDWRMAAKRWDILQRAYPNQAQVWFGAIDACLQAKDVETAEKIHQLASERFPNNPNTLLHGARIRLAQGEIQLAAELFETARKQHPKILEIWLQSSDCALRKGLYDEAEVFNAKARELVPSHPKPHKQYAEIAMQQQDWHTALKRWAAFRKLFPENPAGYILAAESAEKSGDLKLARKLKLAREYGEELLTDSEEVNIYSFHNRRHRHATLTGLMELIWTKAIFNLRSETQRNYLSYLWWVIEPLLHMIIYFLVFGFLLQRGGEGFITFLLTGLIPWMWFSKAVSNSSNSIITGQGLMLQIAIPSIVFPLVSLVQASLKQIPVFLVLFAFVWLQGYPPGLHWLTLVPVILLQTLLIVMFGCILAALVPFVRDISHIVSTGLTFVMFMSGIFYSYESIPEKWQELFLLNPMAFIIKCYREIFIEGIYPDFSTMGIWAVISIIGCALTLISYKKLRYIFPRVVLS